MSELLPPNSFALGLLPRLLGCVYAIAFLSLLVQVGGLYGSRGILPIREVRDALADSLGHGRFLRLPSLFRLRASDRFISGCAAAGAALGLLLALGAPPVPLLLCLWLLYLSFAAMGEEFLSYQWDALLLETGFITIFLPLADPASPVPGLAYRLFLFRFMFSAGVVKLTSRDPNWRSLTALSYHYETQPLPNRIAWYVHHLPPWAQRLSTLGTFVFELAAPFLAFATAPLRLAGFFLLVSFQGLIALTGSYGFFNVLTVVLCVPLLDDRYLGHWLVPPPALPLPGTISAVVDGVFLIFILCQLLQVVRLFRRPPWLSRLLAFPGRWWLTSPYGLFAVMTTVRYEFVIEGSNDLAEWRPYEFRWKPGDPARPPRQAAPHQPRLDWQMWFAALNPRFVQPWLERLLMRLLEGSPPVLALFREVPFRDAPPAYVRLVAYRYRFTDLSTRRATGNWWTRTPYGASTPMTLGTDAHS